MGMQEERFEASRQLAGTGSLGMGGDADGVQIQDWREDAIIVRLTSTGSNPYTGVIQCREGDTDVYVDYPELSAVDALWSVPSRTDWPIDSLVIAWPSPTGTGYVFMNAAESVRPSSPDCSVQINTCPEIVYHGISGGELVESPTNPGSYLPVVKSIRVSYQGWCGPVATASRSSGVATITSAGHELIVGSVINVTGITPTGYNITGARVTAVTTDTISYNLPTDPGPYTIGGRVHSPTRIWCKTNPTDCCPEPVTPTTCCAESPFVFPELIAITPDDASGVATTLTGATTSAWSHHEPTYLGDYEWIAGALIPHVPPFSNDSFTTLGVAVSVRTGCTEEGAPYVLVVVGNAGVSFSSGGTGWTIGGNTAYKEFECGDVWDPDGEVIGTVVLDYGEEDTGSFALVFG